MCTKTKIWKPGQLVTIGHKVYRVVKSTFGCFGCVNINTMLRNTPCSVCLFRKQDGTALKKLKPKQ